MIKTLVRGLAALSLSLVPLIAPAPVQAAEVATLADALEQMHMAEESRTGYARDKFKHWNAGLDAADGCNTRAEVLLAEANEAPAVAAGCKLSGGEWTSYYDDQEVTDPARLDIDHMVPLAEAWDSGA
ncbi:HNH endonuclease, partial [Streptomyces sp. NPDC051907]